MQAILDTLGNLLPYHLLSYSTLLGTQIYQTFITTKICYQALPMREFILLQNRLFPAYFRTQVSLAVLTALTRPPASLGSFVSRPWDFVPLGVVLVTGGLNWIVFGPRTSSAAVVRRDLHVHASEEGNPEGSLLARSTEESDSDGVDSGKIKEANRAFSRNHAMAIHLNALAVVASVWYAFLLGRGLGGV